MSDTEEFTTEQLGEAARDLIQRAEGYARMRAQAAGKGYAIVPYDGEIPVLDRAAAEALRAEGHDVHISSGTFRNTISFPGREIVRAQ